MSGISNSNELEFAVFCIENIANAMNTAPEKVYDALEKSGLLSGYITANYDILHTQSKEYITDEIIRVMREKGVSV